MDELEAETKAAERGHMASVEPSTFQGFLAKYSLALPVYARNDTDPCQLTINEWCDLKSNADAAREALVAFHEKRCVTLPHGWEIERTMFTPASRQEAIDNAVDAIHKTVIRFTNPMTMREHEFLRSTIEDESKKVVGSVR